MPDLPLNREVKYWWVNQNQTFRQETEGGYLWSPKRNIGGQYNQFYENMRGIAPGDVVYSFCDTKIKAIGIAQSYAFSFPKPEEFGNIGPNWHPTAGWKVLVRFFNLESQITPAEHISVLRPLLPTEYSPLQATGRGNQVYLAAISEDFGKVLAGIIGPEATNLFPNQPVMADVASLAVADDRKGLEEWEEKLQEQITGDGRIQVTEKEALIKSRRGQGLYRQRLMKVEKCCRITKVDNPIHLIGSHIKPWRESNNDERLDGENGLLLTPTMDHLFDRGFISFRDNGDLAVSPVADKYSLTKMGVNCETGINVGVFNRQQQRYMEFHRDSIFLKATR
ncbi:MAG: hypothetical protein A2X35_09185 [Elusimicrobia bacterium GWA2_61_42]|nr:MAG: hypothetical protein A2X35_09185 [Elusimicrobia bacterium GWA2_61_42]